MGNYPPLFTAYTPFEFTEDQSSQLRRIVGESEAACRFIEVLGRYVGDLKGMRACDKGLQKPETVRSKLADISKVASKLVHLLDHRGSDVDTYIRQVMAVEGKGVFRAADIDNVTGFLRALEVGASGALEDVQPIETGRPKDGARLCFLKWVAKSFRTELGRKPNASRNGWFDQVVGIALEAAGEPVSDRRSVLKEALQGGNTGENL
jgi:hypothetical protein